MDFPGTGVFQTFSMGRTPVLFFLLQVVMHSGFSSFTLRKKIWKERLDQSLKEYQPLDLQARAYFKDRVREEGMTYKACESWMSTEASALYKSPKQEWSFLDSTSVGENDKSQPD